VTTSSRLGRAARAAARGGRRPHRMAGHQHRRKDVHGARPGVATRPPGDSRFAGSRREVAEPLYERFCADPAGARRRHGDRRLRHSDERRARQRRARHRDPRDIGRGGEGGHPNGDRLDRSIPTAPTPRRTPPRCLVRPCPG
jgi:hypothetical protein